MNNLTELVNSTLADVDMDADRELNFDNLYPVLLQTFVVIVMG